MENCGFSKGWKDIKSYPEIRDIPPDSNPEANISILFYVIINL